MALTAGKVITSGENESSSPKDQQLKNYPFSSLGRQSSIYSLTLDEFQNTLSERGKNFGSMNMDEFLTSIWTAEENQAVNGGQTSSTPTTSTAIDNHAEKVMERQPSLPRQGSLTLPAPLCRKTVDEVWWEIHKEHRQNDDGEIDDLLNSGSAPRQITLGEMTLEDFLVKAGVVREPSTIEMLQSQPQQFGIHATPYTSLPQGGASMAEPSGYAGNSKRNGVYPLQLPQPECYGGRVVSNGAGGGGYGETPVMAIGAPVKPVLPEGMVNSQVDNSSNQYGLEMGGLRGRKRMIDGPVEKVVERRQRRMIKNRESAARSRARKQAYTVELEAELNQLREENAHLKQVLAELERKRKQQYFEEFREVLTKAQKTRQNLRSLKGICVAISEKIIKWISSRKREEETENPDENSCMAAPQRE